MAGFLAFFRKEHLWQKVLVFSALLFVWVVAYLFIMKFFNDYLLKHPGFSNFTAFFVYLSFISVSLFLISWLVDGLEFAFNLTIGLALSFLGLSILNAPLCINPVDGAILLNSINATCRLSIDVFANNVLHSIFPAVSGVWNYYLTYGIFGYILLLAGGIKVLVTLRKAGVKDENEKKK